MEAGAAPEGGEGRTTKGRKGRHVRDFCQLLSLPSSNSFSLSRALSRPTRACTGLVASKQPRNSVA